MTNGPSLTDKEEKATSKEETKRGNFMATSASRLADFVLTGAGNKDDEEQMTPRAL